MSDPMTPRGAIQDCRLLMRKSNDAMARSQELILESDSRMCATQSILLAESARVGTIAIAESPTR
jgi:hypothetical protein